VDFLLAVYALPLSTVSVLDAQYHCEIKQKELPGNGL